MDLKTEELLDVFSGGSKAANPVPDGEFFFAAPELEELQGGGEPGCWTTGDEAFREV